MIESSKISMPCFILSGAISTFVNQWTSQRNFLIVVVLAVVRLDNLIGTINAYVRVPVGTAERSRRTIVGAFTVFQGSLGVISV